MTDTSTAFAPQPAARAAGALYVIIIVCGVFGELAVRASLIAPGDPAATAANIRASEHLFRLGFAADAVMAVSDAAVAVLLFVLLRPAGAVLALMATVFRLVQTAILGGNLLNHHAALVALDATGPLGGVDAATREALALFSLEVQGDGYDLGLIFFGVCSVLVGVLIWRSRFLPRLLGAAVIAAGAVYLIGSALVFLAPGAADAFTPAYAVPLVAETALALWLLIRGVDVARWLAAAKTPSS